MLIVPLGILWTVRLRPIYRDRLGGTRFCTGKKLVGPPRRQLVSLWYSWHRSRHL